MKRQLGVLVAMLLAGTAWAGDKAPAKKAPAEKAPAAKDAKKKAPPAEQPAPVDGAGEGSDEAAPPTRAEIEAQMPAHITGPKLVDLGNKIEIDLPADMWLFEREVAKPLLEKGGDSGENVLAVVGGFEGDWVVVIEYDDVGYVSDKDADQLDAKELFSQYQQGTVQQNVKRRQMGVPELNLDGWSEMPKYEKASHHLLWGLKGHTTEGQFINFFTRVLGRHGYMSLNLIDSPETIEASKVAAAGVLSATRFKVGGRYTDHQEGDKDSGWGLRTLVLGGAGIAVLKGAKGGLLVGLLLALKKGFVVVIAAIAGFFKWLFGRGKKQDEYVPTDSTPPIDPPAGDPPVG